VSDRDDNAFFGPGHIRVTVETSYGRASHAVDFQPGRALFGIKDRDRIENTAWGVYQILCAAGLDAFFLWVRTP